MGERLQVGAIEAGGTKFVCAVGSSPVDLSEPVTIPTTTPAETLEAVIANLRRLNAQFGSISAIGIASFGPLELHESLANWGSILATPKPGWGGINLRQAMADAFGMPVGIDTDVNGAALAEYHWGAAKGCDVASYVTVGTGIGGGTIVHGHPLHGYRHPELGHIFPPRHPDDVEFPGACPFHGACLEGLASGPAIVERWGRPLSEIPLAHPAHDIIAWYLAHLAITLQASVSARRIIFGGGVAGSPSLLPRIRQWVGQLGAGYFMDEAGVQNLVCAPALGARAGVLGALWLGHEALRRRS